MLLESENVCRFNISFSQVVINIDLVGFKIINNTIIQYFIVISGDSVNFVLFRINLNLIMRNYKRKTNRGSWRK